MGQPKIVLFKVKKYEDPKHHLGSILAMNEPEFFLNLTKS